MWSAEDSEESWQKGSPALPACRGALSCARGGLWCKGPILLSEAATWGAWEGTPGHQDREPQPAVHTWSTAPGLQPQQREDRLDYGWSSRLEQVQQAPGRPRWWLMNTTAQLQLESGCPGGHRLNTAVPCSDGSRKMPLPQQFPGQICF